MRRPLTEKPRNAYWEVIGYKGTVILLRTWHTTEASKDVEVDCWRSRIRRREASHCDVISFGKTETIYG